MPPAAQNPFTAAMIGFQIFAPQHGLGPVVEAVAVDLLEPLLGDLLLVLGDLGDVLLEIRTDEERVLDAGDDRHPGVLVGVEPVPRLPQELEVLHVRGVAGLGPVDGDEHDVLVVVFVVNRHT